MVYNLFIQITGSGNDPAVGFYYNTDATPHTVLRYGPGVANINYVPTYFHCGIDPMLRKVMNNKIAYWLMNKEYQNNVPQPNFIYNKIFDQFVYTSGSPVGQLERMRKVKMVREAIPLDDRLQNQLDFTEVNYVGLDK